MDDRGVYLIGGSDPVNPKALVGLSKAAAEHATGRAYGEGAGRACHDLAVHGELADQFPGEAARSNDADDGGGGRGPLVLDPQPFSPPPFFVCNRALPRESLEPPPQSQGRLGPPPLGQQLVIV
jgi:hypothetical protein